VIEFSRALPDIDASIYKLRVYQPGGHAYRSASGAIVWPFACPSPLPITAATHEAALVIAGRTVYAIYDALIIASALEAGCGTLLSEDLQDGQLIDGRLTVRNPFAKGIEAG
jgi:hypothetical protein